jgi:hypothetical protein
MNVSISDCIAAAAFAFSLYSTWRSHRFKKKEEAILELQKKVNELIIEKETRASIEMRQADMGANLVPVGRNSWRLKVFNKGKACAHDVRIDFPDGNNLVIDSDIDDKFPMESMEPGQSVDLITVVHLQTKPKHKIHLAWQDAEGNLRDKTSIVTLP